MWLSAVKLALNAGTHIYKKKQETKMRMADAQAAHAEKMASGELEYSGKLLEARQSDWKDEFVLLVLTAPILVIVWGVFSEDPGAAERLIEDRSISNTAKEVIINMVYQIGEGGVSKFKNMWKALDREDYGEASFQMMDSLWAKQTPNRAKKLAEKMRGA